MTLNLLPLKFNRIYICILSVQKLVSCEIMMFLVISEGYVYLAILNLTLRLYGLKLNDRGLPLHPSHIIRKAKSSQIMKPNRPKSSTNHNKFLRNHPKPSLTGWWFQPYPTPLKNMSQLGS